MKNMTPILILMILILTIVSGCDFLASTKSSDSESNLIVTPVEDPQIAKLILKPHQKAVTAARDPFKPLLEWNSKRQEAKQVEPVKQLFNNLTFIGMIKMGDQAIALLKAGEKKLMLKMSEQYKGFVVTEISNTQVVFSDGATQITLKRGPKK